jgi:topoisomerase-4 subunit A
MVGLDGRPAGKSLREILAEWLRFRFETVTRRTQHKLEQVLDRIHVLEGRMLVLLNVDKVIRIIRNADEPKAELIKAFKLSERQADDILDMRLRQLAKLEHIKVEQELDERKKERKGLEKLLGSRKALEEVVTAELEADAKTFGDKRRTRIEEAEKAEVETPVIDEPVTVIFSKNGWVRARQGWGVDPASLSFKEGDALGALVACRTVDPVVFLDSKGRAYTVEAAQLPSARGDGAPASSLVDVQDGAKIMHCLAGKPETAVVVAATNGYGFVSKLSDMLSNRRAGREFMNVKEGETPVGPCAFEVGKGNLLVAASSGGKMIAFDLDEVGYLARGRGVTLMGLDKSEKLVAVAVTRDARVDVAGFGRGRENVVEIAGAEFARYVSKRALKGRVLPDKVKKPLALRASAKSEPAA